MERNLTLPFIGISISILSFQVGQLPPDSSSLQTRVFWSILTMQNVFLFTGFLSTLSPSAEINSISNERFIVEYDMTFDVMYIYKSNPV